MRGTFADGPITLLPHEARLVVEGMLLQTRLPTGSVPAVRDVILYSAAVGLGGLPLLQRRFAELCEVDLSEVRIAESSPAQLVVEAGGQHAWMVLPIILDALGEAASRHGAALAIVTGVQDPEELRTACALGSRSSLTIFAAAGTSSGPATGPAETLLQAEVAPFVLLAAPVVIAGDAVLERALQQGVTVESALWRSLHHLSNTSLSVEWPPASACRP
jgi:hypothetical protein